MVASHLLHVPRWMALITAITLGAAAAGHAANASEGQAPFDAQCADCHGSRDIARWAAQHPDTEERQAWLDRLLLRHYPPSEEERRLIIEYIEDVIAEADGAG